MFLHFKAPSPIQVVAKAKAKKKVLTSSQVSASQISNDISFRDAISWNIENTQWRDNDIESNHRRTMEFAHLVKETSLETQRTQLGAYCSYY